MLEIFLEQEGFGYYCMLYLGDDVFLGDSRAEGLITFTVPDVRKLTDTGTLSPVIQVRNLPWYGDEVFFFKHLVDVMGAGLYLFNACEFSQANHGYEEKDPIS